MHGMYCTDILPLHNCLEVNVIFVTLQTLLIYYGSDPELQLYCMPRYYIILLFF